MRVVVYVEGPSDKLSMQALLAPLLEQKRQEGVTIDFFETPDGDRKVSVLRKTPLRAVSILLNDPTAVVVAMPDLYPRDKGFPHQTVEELRAGILRQFEEALWARGKTVDARLRERFQVFCFKYELEALILAAEESLRTHLGISAVKRSWCLPVEDQNHDTPPKRIVEDLFRQYGQRYHGTVDAPAILGASSYDEIAEQCRQCFRPFIQFLTALPAEGTNRTC